MLRLASGLFRGFRSSCVLRKEIEIFIDGNPLTVDDSYTVLQACQRAGVTVPHFCFHERLAVAGNCRMCLVDVEKMPKPQASCAMPVMSGMRVNTKTERAYNARGGVMEFLLANHPLDCPICDQGGECDLQDQSVLYGYSQGRFLEYKRAVEDKELGPLIATIMTRCIHCTRCIRFAEEVAGMPVLGTTGRGKDTEVGTYIEQLLTSELSGNLVDLCPVGALTNAPYAFTARPWELRYINSFDVQDALAPAITVNTRGAEVMRILPRVHEELNEEWIHDRSRHAFDGLKRQRLNACLRRKPDGGYEELLWQDALEFLARKLNEVNGEDVLGLIGEHVDVEGAVAFSDFLHKLGCEHIAAGPGLSADFRANYLMNSRITGLEEADLLLLVGVNPKLHSPVLNARIRRNVVQRDMKVALIGTGEFQGYEFEHLGNSTAALSALLEGTHPFAEQLQTAQLTVLLVSSHILQRDDGEQILAQLQALARKYSIVSPEDNWNGLGVLHNNVGHVVALELGVTGAAAAPAAAPKVVYLLGCDSFRQGDVPEDAFVVYQGTHGDEGAGRADLILPSAAYTEKSGTFVNIDGRVVMGRFSVSPPGQARSDWEILRALSEVTGAALHYDNLEEIRFRIAELAPHLIKYDYVEPYDLVNWVSPARAGHVHHSPLSDFMDNFYMTDAISRASPVMAKCSAAFNPTRNTNFTAKY